jgi:chaperonin cofactor prefoldin
MSVVEMAKAHLQNVHSRIEDLKNQKKLIEDEINKLSLYIQKGLQEIEELATDEDLDSEKVSNK